MSLATAPLVWKDERECRIKEISAILDSPLMMSTTIRIPAPPSPTAVRPRRIWIEESYLDFSILSRILYSYTEFLQTGPRKALLEPRS